MSGSITKFKTSTWEQNNMIYEAREKENKQGKQTHFLPRLYEFCEGLQVFFVGHPVSEALIRRVASATCMFEEQRTSAYLLFIYLLCVFLVVVLISISDTGISECSPGCLTAQQSFLLTEFHCPTSESLHTQHSPYS